MASDGLGVHSYWSLTYPMTGNVNSGATLLDSIYQVVQKPMWITEASYNSELDMQEKGGQYVAFLNELGKRPWVQGCAFFVTEALGNDFSHEVWLKDGKSTGILEGFLRNI